MPVITEGYLFVISVTLSLIFLFDNSFWYDLGRIISAEEVGWEISGIFFLIIGGIFLSFYHAFSNKQKTHSEITVLKGFVALVLASSAFAAAVYTYESKEWYYAPFSFWSLVQAFSLVLFSGEKYVGQYITCNRSNNKKSELLLGGLVACLVIGFEKILFSAHWSVVFSSTLIIWEYAARTLRKIEEFKSLSVEQGDLKDDTLIIDTP